MNVLMFCFKLELGEGEFEEKIADSELKKSEITFKLDTARIPSLHRLMQMFKDSIFMKAYRPQEVANGFLYGGTRFACKSWDAYALIRIEALNPASTKIEASSKNISFAECIINDIAKIIKE